MFGEALSYLGSPRNRGFTSTLPPLHQGGGVMTKRVKRVLTNDPGIGVARHTDAGYEIAKKVARKKGVKIPIK